MSLECTIKPVCIYSLVFPFILENDDTFSWWVKGYWFNSSQGYKSPLGLHLEGDLV